MIYDNLTIDKLNGDMAFNEETHKYWNTKYPDRKYTSITTLIGKYHEEFDADFWSSYKALEKLMGEEFVDMGVKAELLAKKKFNNAYLDTFDIDYALFDHVKQEILASYAKANKDACDRGTEYHIKKENRFYEKSKHSLLEYNFGQELNNKPYEFVCEKNNFDLNREHAILPEYLIYYSTKDGILNLAGQMDLLIKDGNDIYILDYKTNAKGLDEKAYFDRRTKKKKSMLYPINNIDDTKLMHYTIQLSCYAWMLQQINPEFNIKMLKLLHIDGEGNEKDYDVEYRKADVERLFKHYKKAIKVQHFRETGKML